MRQVWFITKKISIRHHNDYAKQANLHGYSIKLKGLEGSEPVEFTEAETRAFDKQHAEALSRVQGRFKR